MKCEEDTLLNRHIHQTIPTSIGLGVGNKTFNKKRAMKLGVFEAIQLLEGARNLHSLTKSEKDLLFRVIDFLMHRGQKFELNQDEVYPAYDFICERINHCTMERDMKSSKFNSKTYEKLLLLRDAIRYNHPYEIVKGF